MFNSILQGWINYYGRFYRSRLLYFLRRLNRHLVPAEDDLWHYHGSAGAD